MSAESPAPAHSPNPLIAAIGKLRGDVEHLVHRDGLLVFARDVLALVHGGLPSGPDTTARGGLLNELPAEGVARLLTCILGAFLPPTAATYTIAADGETDTAAGPVVQPLAEAARSFVGGGYGH